MLVKMITTMAGPDGTVQAGAVANVSEEQGERLIEGGYATRIGPPETAAETATAEPDAETAAMPDARPKRRTRRLAKKKKGA